MKFLDHVLPPSSDLVPYRLFFLSFRRSSHTATKFLFPSLPSAVNPSLAIVSTSFILASFIHLPDPSFSHENILPFLSVAIITIVLLAAAICGPLIAKENKPGIVSTKSGEEKVFPSSDE